MSELPSKRRVSAKPPPGEPGGGFEKDVALTAMKPVFSEVRFDV